MSTDDEVFESIKKIFETQTAKEVSLETPIDSLNLDGIDLALIVIKIEEKFFIHIEDAIAEHYASISEVVNHVNKLIQQRGSETEIGVQYA